MDCRITHNDGSYERKYTLEILSGVEMTADMQLLHEDNRYEVFLIQELLNTLRHELYADLECAIHVAYSKSLSGASFNEKREAFAEVARVLEASKEEVKLIL